MRHRRIVAFIAKNIVKVLLLLLAVSFVVFWLISISPIDPVQANVGSSAYLSMSPEKRAQLATYWGSDLPLLQRYGQWLVSFIQGDWGISLKYNAPVIDVIAIKAGNSLVLMITAWLLSGPLGFILGIVAGANRGRAADKAIKASALVLASTPTFWFALIVLMVFSVYLGWLPFGFSVPIGTNAADVTIFDSLRCLVLPAFTLSIVGIPNITLHTREKLIDVLESNYMLMAAARGESKWAAIRHHGLRNIALPALTLQFASISEVFGGSVLVEQVFSYPGLGQAAVSAGLGSDVALLAGIAVVSALFVFVGNLTANLLYGAVDPRIRRGELRHA